MERKMFVTTTPVSDVEASDRANVVEGRDQLDNPVCKN
jgi:hypothetical protein